MLPFPAPGRQGVSLLLLLFSLACAHGGGTEKGGSPVPDEQAGTIRKVGTFGFGIVPDRDPGTRYAPDRLPADLEVDGLRVIFTGRETPAAPGARLWGTPFHVVSIRRAPPP